MWRGLIRTFSGPINESIIEVALSAAVAGYAAAVAKRRVLHDRYFKQAKAEGYLARSAYKLKEINAARNLIRPGNRVLDLGCAPGAWLQVAGELVGARGRVVGIDLKPTPHNFGPRTVTFVGDVRVFPIEELLAPIRTEARPDRRFDVVVSDMAPNTGGVGDAERSTQLCRTVLQLVPAALREGGHLAMKVLEGGEYRDLLDETARMFRSVKGFKPKSSREVSREMYVVAVGRRAEAELPRPVDRSLPPHLRFREADLRDD